MLHGVEILTFSACYMPLAFAAWNRAKLQGFAWYADRMAASTLIESRSGCYIILELTIKYYFYYKIQRLSAAIWDFNWARLNFCSMMRGTHAHSSGLRPNLLLNLCKNMQSWSLHCFYCNSTYKSVLFLVNCEAHLIWDEASCAPSWTSAWKNKTAFNIEKRFFASTFYHHASWLNPWVLSTSHCNSFRRPPTAIQSHELME